MKGQTNRTYLITDEVYKKYFTGITDVEGVLLHGKTDVYFIDARYYFEAQEKYKDTDVKFVLYKGLNSIKDYLLENDVKTVYINFDTVSVTEFKKYKTLGVKLKDGSLLLKKIRSKKNGVELSKIKKSCKIAQKVCLDTITGLTEGVSELQVKEKINKALLSYGCTPSFDTIVAFGKNSAIPHHQSDGTVLTKESCVLIDMGANFNGYASDITRTAYFGVNPSKEFLSVYNAVLTANKSVIETVKAGMDYSYAHTLASDVLKKYGYEKAFTHSLGHGLGLEIHEYPSLSIASKGRLINGQTFTVEPGAYFDGKFGVRIEDTVVMKKSKINRLFTDDKELIIIKP